jgi:CspA family cold shock protein
MKTPEGPRAVSVRLLPTPRRQGWVKWYKESKGYGFIYEEDGGDIYVNSVDLAREEVLQEGQKVTYQRGTVDGKLRALNVEVVLPTRRKGRVKWFNPQKGYGFIDQADYEDDIYVNRTDIVEGSRLFKGQSVTYEEALIDGKSRAVNVEVDPLNRQQGTVKWFNSEKSFGFITQEDGSEIFVHQSDLGDVKKLKGGQQVTYERVETQKGPKAVKVRLV